MIWTLVGGAAGLAGLAWVSTRLASLLSGQARALPGNPMTLLIGLVAGEIDWRTHDSIAAGLVVGVVVVLGLTIRQLRQRRGRRPDVDRAASRLARRRDVAHLAERGARATAERLGAADAGPGVPIGITVSDGAWLYSSWEDVSVDIWGPRTGKTTARAIPALLAAPGAAIVTSNKRDIVDATRGPRGDRGPVWVFDPQQLIGEPATWWWNPLDYVSDEVKARILADLFAAGSRETDARTDAFFDSAGKELLAGLLLAAAVAGRPITQVYTWLCDPTDDEPVDLLDAGGHPMIASAVRSAVYAPEKQRAGVYSTAQQAVAFLTNRAALKWITAPDGDTRGPDTQVDERTTKRRFRPDELVRSGGTLYAVSKEGRGTLGPMVAALTVAVTEAAERAASQQPGGRLAVPMVAVLDEAANVCRWPDLPDLYSHYGSRGICILTFLQSWPQGEAVWGREGMRKLWSAANIRVYGGGVAEVDFLKDLAELTGEFQRPERSRTAARGGPSTTYSVRSERVLDVADLAAMPRGRALVIPSGAKPVLIRTQAWMDGPHADRVRQSLAHHHGARP